MADPLDVKGSKLSKDVIAVCNHALNPGYALTREQLEEMFIEIKKLCQEDQSISLKCKCGITFDRPKDYIGRTNVFYRWKLEFCDDCFKEKEKGALKSLPKIMSILSEQS